VPAGNAFEPGTFIERNSTTELTFVAKGSGTIRMAWCSLFM
jgi:hypothetical protein